MTGKTARSFQILRTHAPIKILNMKNSNNKQRGYLQVMTVAVSSLLACNTVMADPTPDIDAAMLQRFDTNKDGVLSSTEKAAMDKIRAAEQSTYSKSIQSNQKDIMATYDTNHDGFLSPDERAAMIKAQSEQLRRQRADRLSAFDGNGDGSLTSKEKADVADHTKALLNGAAETIKEYDTNKNGKIDPPELEKMKAAASGAGSAVSSAVVQQFDKNGNGKVDPSESKAVDLQFQQK